VHQGALRAGRRAQASPTCWAACASSDGAAGAALAGDGASWTRWTAACTSSDGAAGAAPAGDGASRTRWTARASRRCITDTLDSARFVLGMPFRGDARTLGSWTCWAAWRSAICILKVPLKRGALLPLAVAHHFGHAGQRALHLGQPFSETLNSTPRRVNPHPFLSSSISLRVSLPPSFFHSRTPSAIHGVGDFSQN
jgi:hypothetical protein